MLNLTSADDACKIAERALAAIEGVIGTVSKDSPLLDDFLFLINHRDSFVKEATTDEDYAFENFRTKLRREVGALEMAKRICCLQCLGELVQFDECLDLLQAGGVSQASLFSDYDQAWGEPLNTTRKLFEFYVAAGIRINGNLPVAVAGKNDFSQENPDVVVNGSFPISGIACKVVSGKNNQTMIDNLGKGSYQVSKSGLAKGIVVLDVRHRVDEELMFPTTDQTRYRTFKSAPCAEMLVKNLLSTIADEILESTTPEWRQARFAETHCETFLLVAHSCAVIETAHGPVPTMVGTGKVVPIVDDASQDLGDALCLSKWIGCTVPVKV